MDLKLYILVLKLGLLLDVSYCMAMPTKDYGKFKPSEAHMTPPELIRNNGFKAETHQVTTSDGYVLTIHRIPNPGKPVVFLQHGILSSSADWLANNANESLGYILAANGYDVWLGNFRGNTYSRTNIHLSPKDKQFWMFSWDEMAFIDLPKMIEYVLQNTTSKYLYYIGHSMGTTTAYALFSSQPEYKEKVKLQFSLAPVARVDHVKGLLGIIASVVPVSKIEEFVQKYDIYEFLPHTETSELIEYILCVHFHLEYLCSDMMFLLFGFDQSQINETRIPVYFGHSPAGTSTRALLHYAQLYESKAFMKYDFGPATNMIKYGQKTPPVYPLQNMVVPTILYYGQNDWMTDPEDVATLESKIKRALVKSIKVPYPKWNHIDFVLGIDANKYVYDPIVKEIAKDIKAQK